MLKHWNALPGKQRHVRHTVARPFSLAGTGLHTGTPTVLTVVPGSAGKGLWFVAQGSDRSPFPADLNSVVSTSRHTVLGDGCGTTIATVEHLLATLSACGVDDATMIVDGGEIPLLDGSAGPFTSALNDAGLTVLDRGRRVWSVEREISISIDEAEYHVVPGPDGDMVIDVTIEFDHPIIGRQNIRVDVIPEVFTREIAGARTFGFLAEAEELRRRGLIGGASPTNVLVLEENGLLESQELRWPDEFVRHKALDLLGDLALLGAPVGGEITAIKPSHTGNIELARVIRANGTLRQL